MKRAESVIFKSRFCVTEAEAVYRERECVCMHAFVNVQQNVCVLLSHGFLKNKYAQHIYCLYLGKIDGIAGEQNIYHFCL